MEHHSSPSNGYPVFIESTIKRAIEAGSDLDITVVKRTTALKS